MMIHRLNIEIIEGSAAFISPHAIQVANRRVSADRFIIATGSSPRVPQFPGIRTVPFMTNVEVWAERVPRSLIVVGGRA
jgi:mercuric reductase